MHEEDLIFFNKMSHFGLFFFFLKNRWQESSKEKQGARSEPPDGTQSSTHHPSEQCNGSQRDSQEGADYRQDGKAAAQPPCKEQELDGSTTQSVDNRPGRSSPEPEHGLFSVSLLMFCSKRCREDSVSKSALVKTAQSKHRTNDAERKRKR